MLLIRGTAVWTAWVCRMHTSPAHMQYYQTWKTAQASSSPITQQLCLLFSDALLWRQVMNAMWEHYTYDWLQESDLTVLEKILHFTHSRLKTASKWIKRAKIFIFPTAKPDEAFTILFLPKVTWIIWLIPSQLFSFCVNRFPWQQDVKSTFQL